MSKINWQIVLGAAFSILLWSGIGRAAEALNVEDAWVREAPPHAEVSAAYLTIDNQTSRIQTLIGVSSPQFRKVEIHTTRMANGQVHMQMLHEASIAAHDRLEFKPGAYHLMLLQPLHPLKSGDMVELILKFDHAPQITIQAPIRNAENDGESPHHHDMGDMKM